MDITESVLYKFFFVFGEIEKIDLRPDKGYAFLHLKLNFFIDETNLLDIGELVQQF